MARGRLSEEEMKVLRENPYVSDVAENRIIYTNEFKFRFMKEYLEGKKPTKIFKDAGFEPKILGSKRIERAAHRWRESYAAGSLGSYQDGMIRKRLNQEKKELQANFQDKDYEKLFEKQQEQIDALKAENERLKRELSKYSSI